MDSLLPLCELTVKVLWVQASLGHFTKVMFQTAALAGGFTQEPFVHYISVEICLQLKYSSRLGPGSDVSQ